MLSYVKNLSLHVKYKAWPSQGMDAWIPHLKSQRREKCVTTKSSFAQFREQIKILLN